MKTIYLDRLLMLASHLRYGELGHDIFDFTTLHSENPSHCKTMGCALGECPTVWPEWWSMDTSKDPTLTRPLIRGCYTTLDSAIKFFGLCAAEVHHLFYPNQQSPGEFGGVFLGSGASRWEVADNIVEFVYLRT